MVATSIDCHGPLPFRYAMNTGISSNEFVTVTMFAGGESGGASGCGGESGWWWLLEPQPASSVTVMLRRGSFIARPRVRVVSNCARRAVRRACHPR
jgi:hypothetical protein